MNETELAAIEALGKMDSQDSGISFDVKVKKSSKFQNVHVNIPAWVLALSMFVGGTTVLVLINDMLKPITGENYFENIFGTITAESPEVEEGTERHRRYTELRAEGKSMIATMAILRAEGLA